MKYYVEYRGYSFKVNDLEAAFKLFGFRLKERRYISHTSDCTHEIFVTNCDGQVVGSSYLVGGNDGYDVTKIELDVIRSLCTIYRNVK